MTYLVDEKKIRLNPYNMKKDKKIGSGCEGDVYKVGKYAIKFYKPITHIKRLGGPDVEYLKNIKTKRILLPEKGLYNKKHELVGYYTKYIEAKDKNSFYKEDLSKIIEELYMLKQDVLTLSDNLVRISDWHKDNIVYNEGVYLVDPGNYKIYKDEKVFPIIDSLNIEALNEFIMRVLVYNYTVSNSNYNIASKVNRQIVNEYINSNYPSMVEYLENTKSDSIDEFIMRKVKQAKKY